MIATGAACASARSSSAVSVRMREALGSLLIGASVPS